MGLSVVTIAELFRGIPPAELERINLLFTERRYRKKSMIFSKGDPGDALFLVRQGMVRLVSHSGRGTETILHILRPDSVFGEILLSEEKRAFTAIADTEAVVASLPKQSFVQLLSTIPAFSMNFIRILSRRLANVEKGSAAFGHTWSYHRLANVLLRLAEEHGIQTPKGTALPLRLTHEELANLIGTTRETVTTQMGRFRRMKMIRREGKTLLLDVPRLTRFLKEGEGEAGSS